MSRLYGDCARVNGATKTSAGYLDKSYWVNIILFDRLNGKEAVCMTNPNSAGLHFRQKGFVNACGL